MKLSLVDTQIEAKLNDNTLAGTLTYIVIISEKICLFKNNGTKWSVTE